MRPARSPQGSSLPILPEPTDHLVRTDRRERCPHGIHAGSGVTTFSSTRPLHYRGVDGATSLSPRELFKDLPSRIIHHDVDSVWHSTLHPLCGRKCVTHYTLVNRSPQALLTARYPAEHIGADYHGRFLVELLQNAEDQTTKAGISDGLVILSFR